MRSYPIRKGGVLGCWGRIVSVVTQPGVDYGHTSIYPFVPDKAGPLSTAILSEDGLTFEAHSTDYQSTSALADLVRNHFFFLKVGPELTFRFREAVWALASIEEQLATDRPYNLREVVDRQMMANLGYWKDYYGGSAHEVQFLRTYSNSDRIRYYWADPQVAAALEKLLEVLSDRSLPETLVSQMFMEFEFGEIPINPQALIERHIQRCVSRYFEAGGFH